jgi:nucleoside phosphorylase/CheY-like chemotaxis protein
MRVLLIEDNEAKAEEIGLLVANSVVRGETLTLARVSTLGDAARVLGAASFDLILLDLMLPYLPGGQPSSSAGIELLRQISSGQGLNNNATVVGISAYPDEIESNRSVFEGAGVLILTYSGNDAWRLALTHIVEGVQGRTGAMIDVDFLAICALEEERDGYKGAVNEISRTLVSGLNIHFVRTAHGEKRFGAILRLGRMGLVAATQETALALTIFRTSVVFMSGICAGFKDNSRLGQLIVASPAWEYQAGKWSEDGFEIAPHQVHLRTETRNAIDHQLGQPDFDANLEAGLDLVANRPSSRSRSILGPIATGSAVIADASRLRHIENQQRKVAGLDMEVYGIYYSASNTVPGPKHYYAIKTVVDLADGNKADNLHYYGSFVSARACLSVLEILLPRAGS